MMNIGILILSWGLAIIPLGLIAWLLHRAYSKEKDLERRLLQCDTSLLTEQGFTIERVTLGPSGSQIIENAQIVYPQITEPEHWFPQQHQ